MGEVTGFFYPRTATGKSSLLPPPPWHYSGHLLTVEYRTDPARVAELLPAPLAPAPDDPGAVALIGQQRAGAVRESVFAHSACPGKVDTGFPRRTCANASATLPGACARHAAIDRDVFLLSGNAGSDV